MEINSRTFARYKALIQNAEAPYEKGSSPNRNHSFICPLRTAIIRKYFREHASLDLDAVRTGTKTTWEKAVQLAVFVAENIPHDNQQKDLKKKNAVTLWEYSRDVTTGFNCRWHAILLSELLLAAGIKNTFITCLPEDKDDCDCHVVNQVWLPETSEWAMIDSDMTEYAVGENERPLSLREMREYIRNDRDFSIRVLPGFESSRFASAEGSEYMKCYWAKNLYWFARHTLYGYSLESSLHISDAYLCLVPKGYHFDKTNFPGTETTDDAAFWA